MPARGTEVDDVINTIEYTLITLIDFVSVHQIPVTLKRRRSNGARASVSEGGTSQFSSLQRWPRSDGLHRPLEPCCHLFHPVSTLADDRARAAWVEGSTNRKGGGREASGCPEFPSSPSLLGTESRCPSLSLTCPQFCCLPRVHFLCRKCGCSHTCYCLSIAGEVAFSLWAPAPLPEPGAPTYIPSVATPPAWTSERSANQGLNWLVSYKQHGNLMGYAGARHASARALRCLTHSVFGLLDRMLLVSSI